MTESTQAPQRDFATELRDLDERRQSLASDRQRAEARREQAREDITRLKEQAMQQYGVDNLKDLEALLAEREAANARAVDAYREAIETAEKERTAQAGGASANAEAPAEAPVQDEASSAEEG